jgi:hypothetical protein
VSPTTQLKYPLITGFPDAGWDVNILKEVCLKAVRNAAKELFLKTPKTRGEKMPAKVRTEKRGELR